MYDAKKKIPLSHWPTEFKHMARLRTNVCLAREARQTLVRVLYMIYEVLNLTDKQEKE